MATATDERWVQADRPGTIEEQALAPVPPDARHGKPRDLFLNWVGANVNYVVLLTGSLGIVTGLGFWDTFAAIVVGCALGCVLIGVISVIGPKTGAPTIVASRAAFGVKGNLLPAAFSWLEVLGWFVINTVVAAWAIQALSQHILGWGGDSALAVSLALVLAIQLMLMIYGHATILDLAAKASWVLAALFILMLILIAGKVNLGLSSQLHGNGYFAAAMIVLGVMFSYPVSWANFMADYSRYLPETVSARSVAVWSGLGQFVAYLLMMTIGAALATVPALASGGVPGGVLGDVQGPIHALPAVLPSWFLIPFLFATAFGCIVTNMHNGYTASLGLLALRLRIGRISSCVIVTVVTLAVSVWLLFFSSGFFADYHNFLTTILIWLSPWAAIVVVDYVRRGGVYVPQAFMQWRSGEYWYRNGIFWPGVISLLIGLAAAIAFADAPSIHSFIVMDNFDGADFSFFTGFIGAAISYAVLAPIGERRLAARAPAPGSLIAESPAVETGPSAAS